MSDSSGERDKASVTSFRIQQCNLLMKNIQEKLKDYAADGKKFYVFSEEYGPAVYDGQGNP